MQATEKEGHGPNITEIPRRSLLSEGEGTNIAFHAMKLSYCYSSAAGEYLPPGSSWGQCYEYPLQHSKPRQAAATDSIWLGEYSVM